jgi:hypothetical protein
LRTNQELSGFPAIFLVVNDKNQTRNEILESRRRLKTKYAALFDSIAALLYRHDPMGISFQDNPDEYESEARTILPRLRSCQAVEDVQQVIHTEFVRWFGADTAGSPEHYREIASETWQLWQEHFGSNRS